MCLRVMANFPLHKFALFHLASSPTSELIILTGNRKWIIKICTCLRFIVNSLYYKFASTIISSPQNILSRFPSIESHDMFATNMEFS